MSCQGWGTQALTQVHCFWKDSSWGVGVTAKTKKVQANQDDLVPLVCTEAVIKNDNEAKFTFNTAISQSQCVRPYHIVTG